MQAIMETTFDIVYLITVTTKKTAPSKEGLSFFVTSMKLVCN